MKEFANWRYYQSFITDVVCMQDFSKILTYRCAILQTRFRVVAGSNLKKQIAYALVLIIMQCIGYLLFEVWSSDNSKMGSQNSSCVFFFVLTVLVSFTVHTVRNYIASANLSDFKNGFNVQCTIGARLDLISDK